MSGHVGQRILCASAGRKVRFGWIADAPLRRYGRLMGLARDRIRLRRELGARWEAVGHLLVDGDYLGFNRSDYFGAISNYEKAWQLLYTPWQRRTGGADILEGIANFAVLSDDPDLAKTTLESLRPRVAEIASASLKAACAKLAVLADESTHERRS